MSRKTSSTRIQNAPPRKVTAIATKGPNILAFPVWRPARVPAGKATARPGVAWRLTDEDGNLQVCTIDPPAAGARTRWQVSVWLNETKLFSRRCADAAAADFVAGALMQDQLLGGAVAVGRLQQFKRR